MKTTNYPNMMYDEELDEYVLNADGKCYVMCADMVDYYIGHVSQGIVREFGDLVDCDAE